MRRRTPNRRQGFFGSMALCAALAGLGAAACGVNTNPEDPVNTPGNTLTITEVSPANGPETGGQTVQILGTGLDDGTGTAEVYFGTETATVSSVSSTMLEVVTPVGAPGAVNVQVTNAFGSYTLQTGYTYDAVAASYGAVTILTLYDVINPGQFNPAANDFVDAFASFVAPSPDSLLTALPAADSCQVNPPAAAQGNYTPLHAGTSVQLTLGGLSIDMPDCTTHTIDLDNDGQPDPCAPEDLSYYPEQVIEDPNLFQFQASYTLAVPGGTGTDKIDAFNAADMLLTPTDFTVTSPDIGFFDMALGYTQIATDQDLTLTWSGGAAGDAFFIVGDAFASGSGYTGNTVVCRPADDGSFTIAGTYMQQIASGATHVVLFLARRTETEWTVPPNGSTGQSLAIVYKVGVVAFP